MQPRCKSDKRLKVIDAKLGRAVVLPAREILQAALELRSADWRSALRGPHIAQARVVLQHLLDLPIRIHNAPKPKWLAAVRPEGLIVLVQAVASPTRTVLSDQPVFQGVWLSERRGA